MHPAPAPVHVLFPLVVFVAALGHLVVPVHALSDEHAKPLSMVKCCSSGLLTCRLQDSIVETTVTLHSMHSGNQGMLWSVRRGQQNSLDWVIKSPLITPTIQSTTSGTTSETNNAWLQNHVLYSPPTTSSLFLRHYVPTTFECTFNAAPVLLRAKIVGWNLKSIPMDLNDPTFHVKLGVFMSELAQYEYFNANHSLFDIRPSNVMYGKSSNLNEETKCSNLFDISTTASTNTTNNNNSNNTFVDSMEEYQIWLVDFTVHTLRFYRPDYLWNDKQNEQLWNELTFPTKDGGWYFGLFQHVRAKLELRQQNL